MESMGLGNRNCGEIPSQRGRGARRPVTRYLADNDGLAKRDLVRLLDAWRRHALALSVNLERV